MEIFKISFSGSKGVDELPIILELAAHEYLPLFVAYLENTIMYYVHLGQDIGILKNLLNLLADLSGSILVFLQSFRFIFFHLKFKLPAVAFRWWLIISCAYIDIIVHTPTKSILRLCLLKY